MKRSYQEIKNEVISSFDVKPLIPCPTFPRQAHIVSCTQKEALVSKNVENRGDGGTISTHQERQVSASQGGNNSNIPLGNLAHNGEETMTFGERQVHEQRTVPPAYSPDFVERQTNERKFVYIHPHNSSINLDKMTHRDHSRRSSCKGSMLREQHAISQQSYDNERMDAALVLLGALNPRSNPSDGAKILHTVNDIETS